MNSVHILSYTLFSDPLPQEVLDFIARLIEKYKAQYVTHQYAWTKRPSLLKLEKLFTSLFLVNAEIKDKQGEDNNTRYTDLPYILYLHECACVTVL